MSAVVGLGEATKRSSQRIESIVVGRGVAALLVVLHHAGSIASQDRFYGYDAYDGALIRFTGINFFFVLSGFFIGWVNWKAIGVPRSASDFAVRRMARIYPSYWVVLIPLVILYQLFPGGSDTQREPLNVVLSFLLLPYPYAQPIYGVAWTLTHEILFCGVIAFVIFFGRRFIWVLALWALAIAIAQTFFADKLAYPLYFLFAGVNLQFLGGIATARLFKDRDVPCPVALFSMGLAIYIGLMLLGGMASLAPFAEQLIYLVGSAMIIAGLVGIERKRTLSFSKLTTLFGRASFSLYLIHPITLSICMQVMTRLDRSRALSAEVVVLIISAVAIIAALLFDYLIETPLNEKIAGRLKRRVPWGGPERRLPS